MYDFLHCMLKWRQIHCMKCYYDYAKSDYAIKPPNRHFYNPLNHHYARPPIPILLRVFPYKSNLRELSYRN